MALMSAEELGTYKLFSTLSEGALKELAGRMAERHADRGTRIIEQGTPPDAFYFVKQGKVEVTKDRGDGQVTKLSVMSSGDSFGEIALLTCSHRCSTVTALTDVKLYVLDKTDFEEIIMMDSSFTSILVKKIDDYGTFNKLKTLRPFAQIEPERMLALTDRLTERRFDTGENIVTQGQEGNLYYVVKNGSVGVFMTSKNGGEPEQVAVLGTGEGFGEEALIRDHPRNATVTALEETVVLALEKKDFDRIVKATLLDYAFPEDFDDMSEEQLARSVFLDARIPPEFEEEHIEGAVSIPMEVLRQRFGDLDRSKEYYTYCTNDSRGMAAAFLMTIEGFNAKNLRGGLSGWTGPVATGSDGIHFPVAT